MYSKIQQLNYNHIQKWVKGELGAENGSTNC